MKAILDNIKCWVLNLTEWLKLEDDMALSDSVEIWSKLLYVIPILVSALFILMSFRKNNKIKASELLLKLEEDYRSHFNTLLDIEYRTNMELENVIPKVYRGENLSNVDDKLIEDFEKCLRHFLLSFIIHNKKVDSKLFNEVHKYYLIRICYGLKSHITKYVCDFWPSVYRWFLILHVNLVTRIFILPLIMDNDLPNFQTNKHDDLIPEIITYRHRTWFKKIEKKVSKKVSSNRLIIRYIKNQLDKNIQRNYPTASQSGD